MKRLLGLVGLLALVAGGLAWFAHQHLTQPYRGFAGDEAFVEIPAHSGVADIARRLAEAGVVADRYTFRYAVFSGGLERKLKAGEYRFTVAATPLEVATRLAKGDVFTVPVTFREGLTIDEMAAVFEKSGLGTADEFRVEASDSTRIQSVDPGAHSLEGYLFPDTYPFSRHVGASGAVEAMLARFTRAWDAKLQSAAAEAGLSQREAVTLASLIELETAVPTERPVISGVFHRRLKMGMALQCDPTVIYALMLAHRWDGNIRKGDLQIDSPYNTYRYQGLPPGPIAAPGRAALDASVHPADVPFLYFVSKGDGTHVFAKTLEEHTRNVRMYQIRKR